MHEQHLWHLSEMFEVKEARLKGYDSVYVPFTWCSGKGNTRVMKKLVVARDWGE